MIIPRLKRIKVSSEKELHGWLAKNSDRTRKVMLVTCNKKSPEKHVGSDRVRAALIAHGWATGPSYTLKANLVGHVANLA